MSDFKQGNAMKKTVSVIVTMALLSLAAHAQEQGREGGYLTVQTVVQNQEVLVNDVCETVTRLVGAETVGPGDRVVYTITVEVTGTGTATASVISDSIPTFSTYAPGSITLNAGALSDATDADAGEFDTTGVPTVVVRLGDLTQADGIQTIVFQVTID